MENGIGAQERDFLNFYFGCHNFQQVLTKAAEILKNPLAIFDKNYYTVAYSDTSNVQDRIWLAGKECGCCSFEYAAMLHGLDSLEKSRSNVHPYRIFDDFGTRRRKICPLFSNSVIIGYLSVLEYFTDFEASSDESYHLVTGVLCKELMLIQAIRQSRLYDSIEALLLSALNAEFANRTLFAQRFSGTELEKESLYRLVCINMSNFCSHTTAKRDFKVQLSEVFPRSWSLFYQKYVVLLVDVAQGEKLSDNWKKSDDRLRKNGLFAGISDTFSDLYLLDQYYQQGINAEQLARSVKDSAHLAKYDQYKIHTLLDSISSQERWKYLSSCLLDMQQTDQQSNTEYVATLYTYLMCDKSLTATAENLHVHRNTVVYRIGKIKQLFNIDFSDAQANLQNYMGCLLLRLSGGHIATPLGS